MSRRQDIQSATGVALELSPFGVLQVVRSSAPSGGEVGFAPGCEWFVPASLTQAVGSQGATMYTNIGSNGNGSNPTATWIESDQSSSGQFQFGSATTSTGYMGGGGNLYRDPASTAGVSPSATGAYKILAAYVLPANALDKAGRIIDVSAWGSFAATGNTKQIRIYAGATNATPVTVDGTVTVTGGSAIGDSGALTTNGGGWMLNAQLMKYGAANANTQQSMTTGILAGGTHAGVSAPTTITLTENAAILFVVAANCTTAASDVVYKGMTVTGFN